MQSTTSAIRLPSGYIAAFERMANLATRAGTEGLQPLFIRTPLIQLSKADIIRLGRTLGVDYSITVSCYQADEQGSACGRCDAYGCAGKDSPQQGFLIRRATSDWLRAASGWAG